jgi:hypothetical protein
MQRGMSAFHAAIVNSRQTRENETFRTRSRSPSNISHLFPVADSMEPTENAANF